MHSRRSTELWLLLAATPILLLLFVMLLLTESSTSGSQITATSFFVPIALVAAFFLAHIAIRKFAPNADAGILPIAYLLSGIGICFVLRLAPEDAMKQVAWLFGGIAFMIITIVVVPSIEKLGSYKYTCLLFGLVLLALPVLPFIGKEYNGSRIWLSIAGLSFQPGEIAKIFVVLFLAAYLADNRELLSVVRTHRFGIKLPDLRTLLPLLVMWVVALLIVIFETDLGSALLFFGIFLVMIYIATGRLFYVIIGLALIVIGAFGLYMVFEHVRTRVLIWRNPFADPSGAGFQLVQSLYSLADGGLFGSGIGRGLATRIPFVENDFIFSAIGEETGLLGASAVILLFMLFAIRGFVTAARAKSDVAAFAAAGLTTSICFQAFVIIGGVTGFIPLTGLTLPFMSQGGSSLLSAFIIVGLLLCAGNEGTGIGTEMTTSFSLSKGTGVLGRTSLGRRLTWVITFFAILFALLIANLTYIQVVRADELKDMGTNNHTLYKASQRERGAIITSDNVVLAQSEKQTDGTYKRVYPQKTLASQVVGYNSQRYGSSGIENSMNSTLVGNENFATFMDALRSYSGQQTAGDDVVLTINSKIQKTAQTTLEGKTGACVVLDTSTGAVLAEASSPTYDLNDVSSALSSTSGDGALLNRATKALYAPGSTFKTITLAAALDTGTVTADTSFKSSGTITIGGGKVTNFEKESYGDMTVAEATEHSTNTVFAQIAVKLGAKNLVSYADKFGFGTSLGQDFSTAASLMPDPAQMTTWETAWAGVGQPVGEHSSPAGPQATVMQMASAMETISNNGLSLHPYVVEKVLSPSGATVSTTSTASAGQAISSSTAKEEQKILKKVVTSGTGTAAQISGATVIGKTGTAQTGKKKDNAWFVGTATAGGKSVTVAVLIEQGGQGGVAAAPKAATVMKKALEVLGGLS